MCHKGLIGQMDGQTKILSYRGGSKIYSMEFFTETDLLKVATISDQESCQIFREIKQIIVNWMANVLQS